MREFSMKRSSSNQGSITIYLCLVLSVLLSLIFVGLHSACIAAGRTALASGLEQGLYSLFAGYDREMFDTYGLLFMDGGYPMRWKPPGKAAPPSAALGFHPAAVSDEQDTACLLYTSRCV